jgi:hypothetical protein
MNAPTLQYRVEVSKDPETEASSPKLPLGRFGAGRMAGLSCGVRV